MENLRDGALPVDVTIRTRNGGVEVVVQGDVDASTVGPLSLALEAAEHASSLVVDLSGTAFIDLYGVRALTSCARRRRGRGLDLLVLGPPPSGERILRMAPFCRDVCWQPRTAPASTEPQ